MTQKQWFYAAVALAIVTAIQIALILIAALGLVGCAMTEPYVTVQPIEYTAPGGRNIDPTNWFDDGPEMVITVHNPTSTVLRGTLKCVGSAYVPSQPVEIPPHGEWRGIGQVLNRDVHANPCWIER